MSIYILLLRPGDKTSLFFSPPKSATSPLLPIFWRVSHCQWHCLTWSWPARPCPSEDQCLLPAEPGDESSSTRQAGFGRTRAASMSPVAPVWLGLLLNGSITRWCCPPHLVVSAIPPLPSFFLPSVTPRETQLTQMVFSNTLTIHEKQRVQTHKDHQG